MGDAGNGPGIRGEGVAPLDREDHAAGEWFLAADVGDLQGADGAEAGERDQAGGVGVLAGGKLEEVDLTVAVGVEGVGRGAAVRDRR